MPVPVLILIALASLGLLVGAAVYALQGVTAAEGGPDGAGGASGEENLQGGQAAGDSAVRSAAYTQIIEAAESLMNQGRYGEASALLGPAIADLPTVQGLRLAHAEALFGSGDPAAAYDEMDNAIAIGPDHFEHRHTAASYAFAAGLPEQAETQWLMGRKLAPADPRFPIYLASVRMALGKKDEARGDLLIAVNLDPGIAQPWAMLAELAEDTDVAMNYIRKARELEPEAAAYRAMEARLLRRQGDALSAAQVLQGISRNELLTSAPIVNDLATCLWMLDEKDKVRELLNDALAVSREDGAMNMVGADWLVRLEDPELAMVLARRAQTLGAEGADRLVESLQAQQGGGASGAGPEGDG